MRAGRRLPFRSGRCRGDRASRVFGAGAGAARLFPDLGRADRLLQTAPTSPAVSGNEDDARKAPVVIQRKPVEQPARAEPRPPAAAKKTNAEAPARAAPPTSGAVQFVVAPTSGPPPAPAPASASAAAPVLAQLPPVTRPLPQLPGELGRVDRPLTEPRPAPLAEPPVLPAPAPEPAPSTGRGPTSSSGTSSSKAPTCTRPRS